jgi:cytidine deaminase
MLLALLVSVGLDPTFVSYVGTNMEVSMPTGSLCAERNAIGSALSDDLSLKRDELKVPLATTFRSNATS